MEAKLQAQVRSLTRDVGALREELRQEQKKRERVAAHAKQCEAALAAAQSKVKQAEYVNTKLEQELRTVRDRAEAAAAKSRSGLEAVKGRLTEVEHSVHQRSVDAQQQVLRLQTAVQQLQAAAMPLAVRIAAAGSAGAGTSGRAPATALKSPLKPAGAAAAAAEAASKPEQLHRQFAQVFRGLSQLSALFSGASGPADGGAVANPAPLLLGGASAAAGGAKSVHWQDQNSPANSTCSGSLGGCRPPKAAAAAADPGREQLAAEVKRLRAALLEAQQQAATAATAASAAAAAGSNAGGSSRVEAAMRQLEAVVPQYRAAAQALQGQVTVLKEKLAAAGREKAALQEEVGRWRSIAQRHEASYAEAAAKLHTREAQSLAASTQAQSQTDRLQSDADSLRRRCAELAARLQESQRAVAELQSSLAAKDKLASTQQQTIRHLEATIREQQADIRSALDLVASRPGAGAGALAGAAAAAAPAELLYGTGIDDVDYAAADTYTSSSFGAGGSWQQDPSLAEDRRDAAGAAAAAGVPDGSSSGWGLGGGCLDAAGAPDEQFDSLLQAATAAAEAATAWACGFDAAAAGAREAALAAAGHGQQQPWHADVGSSFGLAGAEDVSTGTGDEWTIPAVGAGGAWLSGSSSMAGSPRYGAGLPGSPHKHQTVAAGASYREQVLGGNSPKQSAAQSLQGSPGLAVGLASVEADIAGLEEALRSALSDLNV